MGRPYHTNRRSSTAGRRSHNNSAKGNASRIEAGRMATVAAIATPASNARRPLISPSSSQTRTIQPSATNGSLNRVLA